MSMSQRLQPPAIINQNNHLENQLLPVDRYALDKIPGLNYCRQCHCLRVKHENRTGKCLGCGAQCKPRAGNTKKGMNLNKLFDMEEGQ